MNPDAQAAQAHVMHGLADKWGMTCIECHQGIVHSLPEAFDRDAVMDALHDRMESEKVNCRLCHEGIGGPPAGDGWD
jgi:nitrate/TMAO reductase-like tetraheme cytochrome c subunit